MTISIILAEIDEIESEMISKRRNLPTTFINPFVDVAHVTS